jgi:hypothetical protein
VQLKSSLPHKEDLDFVLDGGARDCEQGEHQRRAGHRDEAQTKMEWRGRLQIRLGRSKNGLRDAMQLSNESSMNYSVEIDD